MIGDSRFVDASGLKPSNLTKIRHFFEGHKEVALFFHADITTIAMEDIATRSEKSCTLIELIFCRARPSTVVGAFNAEIFLTDGREYGAHTALYITMPSISSREQASETAVVKKRKKNCSQQKNYGRNWSHQTSARRGKC